MGAVSIFYDFGRGLGAGLFEVDGLGKCCCGDSVRLEELE